MRKSNQLEPDVFRKINQIFFENFYEKQRACGLDDISVKTSLPKAKLVEYIQVMLKKKQIHEIFSGKGQATLYIPFDAIKDMMKLEPKPKWITQFIFQEKNEINKAIAESKCEIEKYESFERILYAHDKVLELSLAKIFDFFEFENVVYTDNPEKHDIEFFYEGCTYVVEAKGKSGQADKDDVLQLRGWIDLKLDEGINADKLKGILVVNNHRHIEPDKRKDLAFTEKAKQFLTMNSFIYSSTKFLYYIVKDVVDKKIDLKLAREKFLKGEQIS